MKQGKIERQGRLVILFADWQCYTVLLFVLSMDYYCRAESRILIDDAKLCHQALLVSLEAEHYTMPCQTT